MTREEAIEWFKLMKEKFENTKYAEALNMAIEALEQEQIAEYSSDVISRQMAIDVLETVGYDFSDSELSEIELKEVCEAVGDVRQDMINRIKRMPSAQPFTTEQLQTMQELESAQVEKAYELGKADRPTAHWKDGKWCSNCGEGIPTDVWGGGVEKDEIKFCFSCGARMESDTE